MESVEGQPNSARALRRRAASSTSRAVAALLAAGVIVSAAGCGGSGGKGAAGSAQAGSSPSGSTSSSSVSPAPSGSATASGASSAQAAQAGQDALAAYRAAYADWVAAAATSNYRDPVLTQHLSGQALSYVSSALRVDQVQGSVSKGAPVLHPTIGQLVPADAPTQVVINDVVDTKNWLQYTPDGHLFNDDPGGCRQSQALVVKKDGAWKVDQLALNKVGTGTC